MLQLLCYSTFQNSTIHDFRQLASGILVEQFLTAQSESGIL